MPTTTTPTSPQHAFHVPYHGRWEGALQDLCNIIDTSCDELLMAEINELQCRKQMIGVILHRFLLIQLRMGAGGGDEKKEYIYLRLDKRADPNAGISGLMRTGRVTDANDCAVLAISEDRVLRGLTSTIEATYSFKNQSPKLSDLMPFLRICCEELDRYRTWPCLRDNSWLFCSLVTEHIARQCPEDIDINRLKNLHLASKIRRRIRIRHHVESGQSVGALTYVEQLEFLLLSAKGQVAIGTKESAQQLIKLENMISSPRPTKRGKLTPSLITASPLKFFKRIFTNQPLLTVTLSETIYDVWRNPQKTGIFRDVSKRFRDEAALRRLAPSPGSQANVDFADLAWKLVKYRLYLPAADAALLMRDVERLARRLIEKEPNMYHQGLLHETLTAYGEELGRPSASVTKEPRTRKRDVFEDAITMARLLNDAEPGAHLDSLADSLGSHCLALAELGEYEKASEACRESVELWCLLYRQRFAELRERGSEGGMQQVFRDWCWCYCTDEEACESITEILLIAETILNDTSPIEVTDWPTMFTRYGAFLTAAAAAPEGCKTVRMGRPQG